MYQAEPNTNGIHSTKRKGKIQSSSMDPTKEITVVVEELVDSDSMDACFTAFDKNGLVQY